MNTNGQGRFHGRSELIFLCLAALTWFAFFMIIRVPETTTKAHLLLFGIGSASFSYMLLKMLGYFNKIRILPRKNDPLLVLAAIPMGGVAQQAIFKVILGVTVCSLERIFLIAPFVSLFIFGGYYFYLLYAVRKNKCKIVLDLLPEEERKIKEQFEDVGLTGYIEFLSKNSIGNYALLGRLKEIDLIIISREAKGKFEEDSVLLKAHLAGVFIIDYRQMAVDLTGKIDLDGADLWSYVLSATPQTPLLRAFSQSKAITEPLLAVALGLIFLPILAIVALIVKISSPGPIFYCQKRTGYQGKIFTLVKFRSMYTDSEKNGPQWSTYNDNRITPIGKILRKTRLDELPQLWNVIRGEMSFFGPRPERPEIYQKLRQEVPLFSLRTIVRPGITGWAQVYAGYAASIEESKTKLEYDLYYIQHMSPRLDLIILLKTIKVALLGSDGSQKILLHKRNSIVKAQSEKDLLQA